jgi:hypothetical protein
VILCLREDIREFVEMKGNRSIWLRAPRSSGRLQFAVASKIKRWKNA